MKGGWWGYTFGAVFVECEWMEARDKTNLHKPRVHNILDSVDRDTRLYIELETNEAVPPGLPLLYWWRLSLFAFLAAPA